MRYEPAVDVPCGTAENRPRQEVGDTSREAVVGSDALTTRTKFLNEVVIRVPFGKSNRDLVRRHERSIEVVGGIGSVLWTAFEYFA